MYYSLETHLYSHSHSKNWYSCKYIFEYNYVFVHKSWNLHYNYFMFSKTEFIIYIISNYLSIVMLVAVYAASLFKQMTSYKQ